MAADSPKDEVMEALNDADSILKAINTSVLAEVNKLDDGSMTQLLLLAEKRISLAYNTIDLKWEEVAHGQE